MHGCGYLGAPGEIRQDAKRKPQLVRNNIRTIPVGAAQGSQRQHKKEKWKLSRGKRESAHGGVGG